MMRRKFLYRLFVLLLFTGNDLYAADQPQNTSVEQFVVTGHTNEQLSSTGNAADHLSRRGVDFSSAGGISSLPVIRGLNDDRIKLLIDGAETTSACANHMNPALSYIDASRIHSVDIIAGITPVSTGGDSIGGTIAITSEPPAYAENAEDLLISRSVAYFYRSNHHNHGLSLKTGLANDRSSLSYSGSYDKEDSYRDGNGDKVLDTLYKSESHNLTLGIRGDKQAMSLKLTHQKVPYQGFPNQYMDMVDNTSYGINFNYLREFSWGELDTRISWQDVDHKMGFFTDEKPGTMPMVTEGRDLGYKIAASIPYGDNSTLRLGNEYHQFTLDDWWPAVEGSMMMGPNDYININDGKRTRYALYAESENNLSEQWYALVGIRYEQVVMDTGDVQPYNTIPGMMGMNLDAPAADVFNALNHRRNDDNVDVTVLARYSLNSDKSIEFGYARKTRSPNLYERYSWGRGTMAMTMIGWFGDGNGYVGNIDLNSEIAHTLGATLSWHKDDNLLSVSPYYTYVDDFIDAQQVGSFNPRMAMMVARPRLQFTNIDASLYGIEIQTRKQLLRNNDGSLILDTRLAYTRGERSDNGGDLYHIMPLNIKVGLEQLINDWTNRLELEWVDNKNKVDNLRLENKTASYTLVNISTAYQWQQFTVSAGITNLLDRNYDLPLGGVYLSGWLGGNMTELFTSLSGEGRSINLGIGYTF
jgi:iron complex outermembrane receptor protein